VRDSNGQQDDRAVGAVGAVGPVGRSLRTPRAAGAAGIVFAVLLAATIVLVHSAIPGGPAHGTAWLGNASSRSAARAELRVLPFAGIIFLWFMGAVRSHIGEGEDKFFATVFLGSGLLFTATLFALAAQTGALLALSGTEQQGPDPRLWEFGRGYALELLSGYCMRMAAVFAACTSTIGLRLRIFPRWLIWCGYLIALLLLFVAQTSGWFQLVFPLWVLLVSIHMLVSADRRQRPERSTP
jgi:hypothetical protein